MRRVTGWMALVSLAWAPLAWGGAPAGLGGVRGGAAADPAGSTALTPSDEQVKVGQIQVLLDAQKFDEAISEAGSFLRNAREDAPKIQATRIVAEAQRKKGAWSLAQGAYLQLRDRYRRGTDDYVRWDAVADILRASPTGVYQPLAASGSDAAAAGTLADDTVLAKALAALAETRAERLRARLSQIKRARTPAEVAAALAPIADEFRQLRLLAESLASGPERDTAQAAALRLAELAAQMLAALKAKQVEFQHAIQLRRLDARGRRDMEQCQALCADAAKAEEAFRSTADRMKGTANWPEGDQLKTDSASRQKEYEQLAKALTPPPPPRGGTGAEEDYGRGGGGGGPGPGGGGIP